MFSPSLDLAPEPGPIPGLHSGHTLVTGKHSPEYLCLGGVTWYRRSCGGESHPGLCRIFGLANRVAPPVLVCRSSRTAHTYFRLHGRKIDLGIPVLTRKPQTRLVDYLNDSKITY